MNAAAPPGLPYGESAVLAQGCGDSDSLLFFIDGGKPCAPMHVAPARFSLVQQVATVDINQDTSQPNLERFCRDEQRRLCDVTDRTEALNAHEALRRGRH